MALSSHAASHIMITLVLGRGGVSEAVLITECLYRRMTSFPMVDGHDI